MAQLFNFQLYKEFIIKARDYLQESYNKGSREGVSTEIATLHRSTIREYIKKKLKGDTKKKKITKTIPVFSKTTLQVGRKKINRYSTYISKKIQTTGPIKVDGVLMTYLGRHTFRVNGKKSSIIMPERTAMDFFLKNSGIVEKTGFTLKDKYIVTGAADTNMVTFQKMADDTKKKKY